MFTDLVSFCFLLTMATMLQPLLTMDKENMVDKIISLRCSGWKGTKPFWLGLGSSETWTDSFNSVESISKKDSMSSFWYEEFFVQFYIDSQCFLWLYEFDSSQQVKAFLEEKKSLLCLLMGTSLALFFVWEKISLERYSFSYIQHSFFTKMFQVCFGADNKLFQTNSTMF